MSRSSCPVLCLPVTWSPALTSEKDLNNQCIESSKNIIFHSNLHSIHSPLFPTSTVWKTHQNATYYSKRAMNQNITILKGQWTKTISKTSVLVFPVKKTWCVLMLFYNVLPRREKPNNPLCSSHYSELQGISEVTQEVADDPSFSFLWLCSIIWVFWVQTVTCFWVWTFNQLLKWIQITSLRKCVNSKFVSIFTACKENGRDINLNIYINTKKKKFGGKMKCYNIEELIGALLGYTKYLFDN